VEEWCLILVYLRLMKQAIATNACKLGASTPAGVAGWCSARCGGPKQQQEPPASAWRDPEHLPAPWTGKRRSGRLQLLTCDGTFTRRVSRRTKPLGIRLADSYQLRSDGGSCCSPARSTRQPVRSHRRVLPAHGMRTLQQRHLRRLCRAAGLASHGASAAHRHGAQQRRLARFCAHRRDAHAGSSRHPDRPGGRLQRRLAVVDLLGRRALGGGGRPTVAGRRPVRTVQPLDFADRRAARAGGSAQCTSP
jgi:hypothetical protein